MLTLVAIAMLWDRPLRVVDLWLMLVMWVWLFDIGLSAVVGSSRFDLGFYVGRMFGLVAASLLLVTLLIEMMKLHVRAIGATADAEKGMPAAPVRAGLRVSRREGRVRTPSPCAIILRATACSWPPGVLTTTGAVRSSTCSPRRRADWGQRSRRRGGEVQAESFRKCDAHGRFDVGQHHNRCRS
jgi:hypothetical protein